MNHFISFGQISPHMASFSVSQTFIILKEGISVQMTSLFLDGAQIGPFS